MKFPDRKQNVDIDLDISISYCWSPPLGGELYVTPLSVSIWPANCTNKEKILRKLLPFPLFVVPVPESRWRSVLLVSIIQTLLCWWNVPCVPHRQFRLVDRGYGDRGANGQQWNYCSRPRDVITCAHGSLVKCQFTMFIWE